MKQLKLIRSWVEISSFCISNFRVWYLNLELKFKKNTIYVELVDIIKWAILMAYVHLDVNQESCSNWNCVYCIFPKFCTFSWLSVF